MARKRYDLAFHIDSSRAVESGKRVVRALESAEAAAKRAGNAMESAYNRAAAAANKAAQAMANATSHMPVGGSGPGGGGGGGGRGGLSLEDRYLKADYDRRVRYEARKQKMIADAAAQAARQSTAQAEQLAAIEDQYVQRDYSRRVAHERRQIAQKEREKRHLAAIEDRFLRQEYRRQAAFQAKQAADQEAASKAAVAKSGAILKVGLGVATASALAGLKFFVDGYAKIREDAERAADATLDLRKYLNVEAVLKGADQTTKKELVESLTFRAETALGQTDATEFTRQYLGSVPIARQKHNITPQVEKDLMKEAGIMAARQGGDAGTRGELAGLLGQFGKIESVESGMGQLEAIRVALTEGRGDDTPLTRQLLQSAGSMVREGGAVGSLREQAALIGVTSLSAGPEAAATRAEQLSRALRAGLTKMTGGKGTEMPQGEYLKSLGVSEKDNLESALGKLIPDLRKSMAEGRQAESYLSERGFRSEEERKAIIEVESVYEQLVERFAAARKAGSGAEARAANQRFLASPVGRRAVAEALNKIAETTRGIPEERVRPLLSEAEATREFQESEASMGGTLGNLFRGMMEGHFTTPIERGRQLRLEGIGSSLLNERARKAGVSNSDLEQAAENYRTSSRSFPSYVNEVEGLINAKGGNTAIDIKPTLDRLVTVMEENNRLVKDNNDRMGGRPPIAPLAPRQLGPRP